LRFADGKKSLKSPVGEVVTTIFEGIGFCFAEVVSGPNEAVIPAVANGPNGGSGLGFFLVHHG
jgi:hypothetical protein